MAFVQWTREQMQVIETRDRNLLVSAAAGSGKTAVLVERIIRMVTDENHPVDIDKLLVMTFTNAAASEMRERIGDALEKRLEECPGNINLERQTTLIHHAKITTIDSFCLKLLREHFNELDIDPGFRIGDEGEVWRITFCRCGTLLRVIPGLGNGFQSAGRNCIWKKTGIRRLLVRRNG